MKKNSIAMICHVWTPDIQTIFERLQHEAPADHDVRFLLNTKSLTSAPHIPDENLEQIAIEDLFRLPYPEKCHAGKWDIAGNLDLAFLEFRRRLPNYKFYWFVEYDVHYEGNWKTFFEHFQNSDSGLICTSPDYISNVPKKLKVLDYPLLVVPNKMGWNEGNMIKGFFPICRLSNTMLDVLDQEYREGLSGHYEITMPTLALLRGLIVEDIGGNSPFVRNDNRNRFYFANGATYTHSPGNFVFRPNFTKVLPRKNTLWHPVKTSGVPHWHPLRIRGNFRKNVLEAAKRITIRAWIWLWFATRWRPLKVVRPQNKI